MQQRQSTTSHGSASRWGPLWGARPADWALSEDQQTPTYEAALERVHLAPSNHVLEVGCGVGSFLRLVAARGAIAHGIDASEALVAFARGRLPDIDIQVGEMEALPYPDDSFDVVAGFNTFFFADDMVAAMREAGRVAKPGAPVIVQVYGRHERCDLEAMKAVMRPLLPPRPADAPADPDLSQPGLLEDLAREAGLAPETAFLTSWAYTYPDDRPLGRAMPAPAGLALLVGPDREAEVQASIVEALAPCRRDDGSYRIANEYRILITRA